MEDTAFRYAGEFDEVEVETSFEDELILSAPPVAEEGDREPLRGQFSRNLRLWRIERAMNQTELANAAGLSRAFVAKIEAGSLSVSLDTLEHLADALQIEPSLLIGPLCLSRPRLALRELRERKGLTQSKLATVSGVSRVSINRIETGKAAAGPRAKRALAQALGVHPATIN